MSGTTTLSIDCVNTGTLAANTFYAELCVGRNWKKQLGKDHKTLVLRTYDRKDYSWVKGKFSSQSAASENSIAANEEETVFCPYTIRVHDGDAFEANKDHTFPVVRIYRNLQILLETLNTYPKFAQGFKNADLEKWKDFFGIYSRDNKIYGTHGLGRLSHNNEENLFLMRAKQNNSKGDKLLLDWLEDNGCSGIKKIFLGHLLISHQDTLDGIMMPFVGPRSNNYPQIQLGTGQNLITVYLHQGIDKTPFIKAFIETLKIYMSGIVEASGAVEVSAQSIAIFVKEKLDQIKNLGSSLEELNELNTHMKMYAMMRVDLDESVFLAAKLRTKTLLEVQDSTRDMETEDLSLRPPSPRTEKDTASILSHLTRGLRMKRKILDFTKKEFGEEHEAYLRTKCNFYFVELQYTYFNSMEFYNKLIEKLNDMLKDKKFLDYGQFHDCIQEFLKSTYEAFTKAMLDKANNGSPPFESVAEEEEEEEEEEKLNPNANSRGHTNRDTLKRAQEGYYSGEEGPKKANRQGSSDDSEPHAGTNAGTLVTYDSEPPSQSLEILTAYRTPNQVLTPNTFGKTEAVQTLPKGMATTTGATSARAAGVLPRPGHKA